MIIATDLDMREYGRALAKTLSPSDWVAINGPLGAGKTVLCAGILAGLGFEGEVASPSYAIVHSYEPPEVLVAVAHVDLYRLDNIEDLDELGLIAERSDRGHWPTLRLRKRPQIGWKRPRRINTAARGEAPGFGSI